MGSNGKFMALVTLLFILLGVLPNISERRDNYSDQNIALDTTHTTDTPKKDYVTSINIGEVTSQEIALNWDKIDEVAGYTLYRSDSEDGEYTEIYTIVDNNVTTYIDKNLTPWTNYYYKIKTFTIADGNREYGPDSNVIVQTTSMEVPVLDIEKTNNSHIKVSWTCDTNLDGYILYKATNEEGYYDDIEDVDNPLYEYYIDKDIKSNNTYYYKIRGYKYKDDEKIYGDYSEIKNFVISE